MVSDRTVRHDLVRAANVLRTDDALVPLRARVRTDPGADDALPHRLTTLVELNSRTYPFDQHMCNLSQWCGNGTSPGWLLLYAR